MADVIALNLGQREAFLDDGRTCPITNMLDADGDETDDPEEAREDEWLALHLGDFGAVAH